MARANDERGVPSPEAVRSTARHANRRAAEPPILQLAGIAVQAVSVGGLETCIQLPGYDLCFDIGKCPPGATSRRIVLFTHAHIDHMGSVVHHAATRSMRHMAPPIYVVPRPILDDFRALFDVWRRLDGSDLPCRVIGADPGDEIPLARGLVARPFRSIHPAVCQGYGILRKKRKLVARLRGASPSEIVAARRRGEVIHQLVDEPEVVFTGDSRIEVVEREEVVRKARLLVMEVTFLDERVSVKRSRAKGHIHLDEVIERAHLFENRAILFTHLSARYRPDEAQRILRERLPDSLRHRVTLLLPPRPRD